MRPKLSFVVALSLALGGFGLAQETRKRQEPVVHERKDAAGRLLRRVVFNPDGTVDTLALSYAIGEAKVSVEEHLDAARVPGRRHRETFDEAGRIAEREDTSVENGTRVGTLTKFRYDASGRQTVETKSIP